MGHADYLKLGDHNGICKQCGFKYKFSELRITWDGIWSCRKCWDPRHPQLNVRAKADKQIVQDNIASEPTDIFIGP